MGKIKKQDEKSNFYEMENIRQTLNKIDSLKIQSKAQLPFSIMPFLYNRITTKELLHSEIIASFLNPKSEHNCGTFFLFNFFDKIGIQKDEYNEESNFNIDIEFGIENLRRIDILITWENKKTNEKKAIIIENKLNDAIDQKNQIKDYFTAISSQNFNVLKIVYIPRNQKKYAPPEKLDEDISKLICVIYPKVLIEWMGILPNIEDAKESCISYSNLLKYMNMKNENIENAHTLLKKLSNDELKSIVTLYNIIKTSEWNLAVLSEIVIILKEKNDKIIFNEKENRYIEIYYEGYKFWIELYFYFEDKVFKLWIADDTHESFTNVEINNLGFKHDVMSKGFHYFKNVNMHSYEFPSDNNYKKLVEDILRILEVSK